MCDGNSSGTATTPARPTCRHQSPPDPQSHEPAAPARADISHARLPHLAEQQLSPRRVSERTMCERTWEATVGGARGKGGHLPLAPPPASRSCWARLKLRYGPCNPPADLRHSLTGSGPALGCCCACAPADLPERGRAQRARTCPKAAQQQSRHEAGHRSDAAKLRYLCPSPPLLPAQTPPAAIRSPLFAIRSRHGLRPNSDLRAGAGYQRHLWLTRDTR